MPARIVLVSLLALGAAAPGVAARAEERPHFECFSTAQTRDKILAHNLSEPFGFLQAASRQGQSEALGARLCRDDDEFIYEIRLLRRDGRVEKIFVDAASGKPHAAHKERAAPGDGDSRRERE
jgi:hypothetical protein